MHNIFGSVKSLLKLDSVNIDNNVFRLHYKATVVILITFSLIVTSRQYIGDPIDCIVNGVPNSIMDTYCWIHSTFTLPDWLSKEVVGEDSAHPGVRPIQTGDTTQYQKFYQWVCFVLFFQAILFYIPRYLWKNWEAGKMKMLVLDLDVPMIAEDTKNDRKKLLVDYFTTNFHKHNPYAIRFFLCELLNFINVIGQIFFVDYFLGGEFRTYGTDVINMMNMEPKDRVDPMAKVFPKMTKCTFHKYGGSGTPETYDGLCILPLNIVNEKIYIFLWFWFVLLATVSGLALLYRLAVVSITQARMYLLRNMADLAPQNEVDLVVHKCQIGDWFVLQLIGKNIDPLVFKEFICDLASRLKGEDAI